MFHGRQKIREYMMLTVNHSTILGIDRWFLLTRNPWLSLKRLSYNRLLCPNRLTAQNGANAHEPVCHLGQKALFPSGEGREGPFREGACSQEHCFLSCLLKCHRL